MWKNETCEELVEYVTFPNSKLMSAVRFPSSGSYPFQLHCTGGSHIAMGRAGPEIEPKQWVGM